MHIGVLHPKVFRTMMAACIVRHDLPLQFMNKKDLFSCLNLDVSVFSKRTTKTAVVKLFTCENDQMKYFLQSFSNRVSFTSDSWTSINTSGYISVTTHDVDNSWILHKRILNFSFLPPPHNGVTIVETI